MKILITGADGFVGRNLQVTLNHLGYELFLYDRNNTKEELNDWTKECDFVVHLAGVNRPTNVEEFYDGNAGFTETLCKYLASHHNKAPILVSSSIQAELDNDYGKSKREGEEILIHHGQENNSPIYIYRFSNLFGKWCRPNYNSVIATWCHLVARNEEITINNPETVINFMYIDDVVNEIINCINGHPTLISKPYCTVSQQVSVSLGEVSKLLFSFKESRKNCFYPDLSTDFSKKLYSTYLTYLPEDQFSYLLKMNQDHRGSFTEFLKDSVNGQVSINVSKPGITKGQHWHHTKNEKFLVVSGEGMIQFRHIFSDHIIEYRVSGEKLEVVDIPPGYTHNIINLSSDKDLVTVMWANELFDPEKPDTHYLEV